MLSLFNEVPWRDNDINRVDAVILVATHKTIKRLKQINLN
ncbi:hypothetical protein swp_4430 [Shewanella piezotolerans WP3]|uniref:Uncharacterized protein n=1 Tax=Shewanella piezotolerans (strain WP3 / JCM 13877) TaxID=225849 RepID=B8CTG4_SHEPW|nr:hypothetical protein swp_4430 [Shewanella piezotolerans WP3]